jgi:hypothetical protein
MRGLHFNPFLVVCFGLLAIPAVAHEPQPAWADHQRAHEEQHQADHAVQDADRHEWHSRRDAERGDYEGAAEAHQRAHEALDDSRQHYRRAEHYNEHAH